MPSLYFTLLRNILRFFKRRELCRLLSVCHRFRQMVENDSKSPPYLVMSHLSYTYDEFTGTDQWVWAVNNESPQEPMPKVMALKLWNGSVRFKEVTFWLDTHPDPILLLESISHIWEGFRLSVWCESDMPWLELASVLSSKSPATLSIAGMSCSFALTKHLKSGPDWISVEDSTYVPTVDGVPIADIVQFLFKPPTRKAYRQLLVISGSVLSHSDAKSLIDTIAKTFLAAVSAPLKFVFNWECLVDEDWSPAIFEARNWTTNQRLCLRPVNYGVSRGFCLETLS
ncbi:hypothetical protein Ddc_12731 [Ditylenchus destructor]|nr:hypothetical protein Ddc_12731 [Ditylenchus destructor]